MQKFDTMLLENSEENIDYCADLIKKGEVVGIPTETVYGLAGSALCEDAIDKIFSAKGRPQDNPLIVHIGQLSQVEQLAQNIPKLFYELAEEFWPGPLTMIVEKKDIIPNKTSGGLSSVGLRMPYHPVALEIIRRSGFPVAAPSGNVSGAPSPTTARDMFEDMQGKIPAVIDGGFCNIGIESTVISFEKDGVRLLRPGLVSAEDLAEFTTVYIDNGVEQKLSHNEKTISPGMKYKHYSPKAKIIIFDGTCEEMCNYISEKNDENAYAVIANSDESKVLKGQKFLTFGDSLEEQAKNLFFTLRELDRLSASKGYFLLPNKSGVGLALFNRLIRAAGFKVVKL